MLTHKLRMTRKQKDQIIERLNFEAGNENIVFGLAGYGNLGDSHIFAIHELFSLPEADIVKKSSAMVTWKTESLFQKLQNCNMRFRVVKFHSHFSRIGFSEIDNISDEILFPRISSWQDYEMPGLSVIVYPDGEMISRLVESNGNFSETNIISIIGDDLEYFRNLYSEEDIDELSIRTSQVLGKGTTKLIESLKIGIVGLSGTGSPVCEMLSRLGVGEMVLVDPDVIEEVNLGRIINSTLEDAQQKKLKVHVQKQIIKQIGFKTNVTDIAQPVQSKDAINALKDCDVIFGCVDSAEGRHILNKISDYYIIPYFDLGVSIKADGFGGISYIWETVHYVSPGNIPLIERGAYSAEMLRAESLKRENPQEFENQLMEKYIEGGQTKAPAVISVNMLVASLAVNEFLCRLHKIRDISNKGIIQIRISPSQTILETKNEREFSSLNVTKYLGFCDTDPLLHIPSLG